MIPREWNSTLPQRSKGLSRGKGFKPRSTGLSRNPAKKLGAKRPYEVPGGPPVPAQRRSPGEFTPATRLLTRTRAGDGDPTQARCEAGGEFLGEHGGQFQHIYARGAGGSGEWLYRSAANAALLCGTRYTGDHGLCEDRDPDMLRRGFWRKRNGREKPGDYPVQLYNGTWVYLTPAGGYLDAPSWGAAA